MNGSFSSAQTAMSNATVSVRAVGTVTALSFPCASPQPQRQLLSRSPGPDTQWKRGTCEAVQPSLYQRTYYATDRWDLRQHLWPRLQQAAGFQYVQELPWGRWAVARPCLVPALLSRLHRRHLYLHPQGRAGMQRGLLYHAGGVGGRKQGSAHRSQSSYGRGRMLEGGAWGVEGKGESNVLTLSFPMRCKAWRMPSVLPSAGSTPVLRGTCQATDTW